MNILLIDKEVEVLERLEGLIRSSNKIPGVTIGTASSPEDAVQRVVVNGPDLVVIDPLFSLKWGWPIIQTVKDLNPGACVIVLCDCSLSANHVMCREWRQEPRVDCHIDKTRELEVIPGIVSDIRRASVRMQPFCEG